MDESFDIPVIYKGEQLYFKGWLLVQGYTYKFKVIVNGADIFFEPGDDGSFRALFNSGTDEQPHKNINIELLQAVAEAIQSLVN